jgi:hypothetical protein
VVKNNQGWSPSDYAYSFEVMATLQEIAVSTHEANKRERAARKMASSGRKRVAEPEGTPVKGKDKPLPPDLSRSSSNATVTASTSLASLVSTSRSMTPIDTPTANSRKAPPSPKSPVEKTAQRQMHADYKASPFRICAVGHVTDASTVAEYRARAISTSDSDQSQSKSQDGLAPSLPIISSLRLRSNSNSK